MFFSDVAIVADTSLS